MAVYTDADLLCALHSQARSIKEGALEPLIPQFDTHIHFHRSSFTARCLLIPRTLFSFSSCTSPPSSLPSLPSLLASPPLPVARPLLVVPLAVVTVRLPPTLCTILSTDTNALLLATFYNPAGGFTSCGQTHQDTDMIVAVDHATITSFPGAGANPNT